MNKQSRIDALLEQATVDCNNEEEELGECWSRWRMDSFFRYSQGTREIVTVMGLNSECSSLRRGIIARVRKGDREYNVSLAELEFVDLDRSVPSAGGV